jgi:hypothetical protein
MVTKHSTLGLTALAGLFGIALHPGRARSDTVSHPVAVIELFTSQGCSSCPPADRLLADLAQRPGIIALSFPVTYWDYLGWRDTLARPENAQRQRNYALARGDGQVYTPQVIVNGVEGCVGSNLAAIESAVQSTSTIVAKDAVPLLVKRENGQLFIETGGAPPGAKHKSGTVWVASVSHTATVPITKGENAGSHVTYTNVVRGLTAAGEWQGQPTSYALPLSAVPKDGDMLVVFLQEENLGAIVAAARIDG